MPVPLIAPIIGTSLEVFLGLMRIARDTNEMNKQEFDAIKARIDKEFSEIPEWDEL